MERESERKRERERERGKLHECGKSRSGRLRMKEQYMEKKVAQRRSV